MFKYSIFILLLFVACKIKNEITKPTNLSNSAMFKGGIDGGVWIDTTSNADNCLKVSIYSMRGDSIAEFNFFMENQKQASELINNIIVYDGVRLNFRNNENYATPCK